MVIVTRSKGEQVHVGKTTSVEVLDIHAGTVKLGCSSTAPATATCGRQGGYPRIGRHGWNYFLFPKGGRCLHVFSPSKGETLHIDRTAAVVVIDINQRGVQLGIDAAIDSGLLSRTA